MANRILRLALYFLLAFVVILSTRFNDANPIPEELQEGSDSHHHHHSHHRHTQLVESVDPGTRIGGRVRRSFTCNRLTGDRLCFMAPFKWRCTCGVMGCVYGQCQCNVHCRDNRHK